MDIDKGGNILRRHRLVYAVCLFLSLLTAGCGQPHRADRMRQEKRMKDSVDLLQAEQTVRYSDSLLSVLQLRADTLLAQFRYEKDEQWEDKGRYVHRLLLTQQNTRRNYLQATVRDDGNLTLQSFFFGERAITHNKVRLSAGELWVEAEGGNHSFEAEGIHEILTIPSDDARHLLSFISENAQERLLVTISGKQSARYYLPSNEKQALAETYRLALTMTDIATLEQAIKTNNARIQMFRDRKARQQ